MKILELNLTCQMILLLAVINICTIFGLAHPTATVEKTGTLKEEKCLAKNMEHLTLFCTYPGKQHPCFEGTILYQNRPIHLINMKGAAAHMCAHGTQMEVAASYCCFTEKCLRLCYQKIDYDAIYAKKNAIIEP